MIDYTRFIEFVKKMNDCRTGKILPEDVMKERIIITLEGADAVMYQFITELLAEKERMDAINVAFKFGMANLIATTMGIDIRNIQPGGP